ncbi:MAG TPA: 2-amino-4-hydroxy-6-hydroxymethyldihydropteridine diphosphokinase [Candidatus Methylacidiphilales bacterium]|nr:2-amino-4-hydroxy-6-hydroxymethyldihydropteridine diphosphokinase [Candidatus Methylacidiphilales bacterium]
MSIVPAGIALGSNLGDRAAELAAGVVFLRLLAVDGRVCVSSTFETAPVDCSPDSPPFLNGVAEIRIDTETLPPRTLLAQLKEFEASRGRAASGAINAPRPIDLDILYYACLTINEPGLTIPHPRAHLRRFVLEPLGELRPDLILPGQTLTVGELLERLPKG